MIHNRLDKKKSGSSEYTDRLNTFKEKAIQTAYKIGAKLNPRELQYGIKRAFNKVDSQTEFLGNAGMRVAKEAGLISTDKQVLKSMESIGIQKQKNTIYNNLDSTDISRFKKYTDAARYSRNINSYLAIKEPPMYKEAAQQLKESLSKNSIDNMTVFRSCNFKFSTPGLAQKLNQYSEADLQKVFNNLSKNYSGKSLGENRVFSTSTSPLFAIDTWRSVNPTAASTYNAYMIINTKNCPGILADGRTSLGAKLVNTRSNQEAILAPGRLVYRNLRYDKKRKMFAITVDAIK